MHLPTKFCANSSIQFRVIDIFWNPRWRPPPSWIFKSCTFGTFRHVNSAVLELYIKFCSNISDSHCDQQFMWIWPFQRVDSMVFVFCTKFGSNICYSHWDRRTYGSDLHLMTSRELTSGFDFWSCGHLCVAVMHLPMKFGADIFIQPEVIDIFRKLKMVAATILDLFGWAKL